MKIIYMGTPYFAIAPLMAIIAAGHEVSAVVTRPDKERGRGRAVAGSAVKEYALSQGLDVLQPPRLRGDAIATELRDMAADVFVVAAYGQILPAPILALPSHGCVNIHASLLPRYRGAAPIQRAVIDGAAESGITIMQMDEGVDTGEVMLAGKVELAADETAGTLTERLSLLGAELIVQALARMEEGTITRVRQDGHAATHAPMIAKDERLISWDWPAVRIERLIRGLSPRPGAQACLDGKALKIWSARPLMAHGGQDAPPGTVIGTAGGVIEVACGGGVLAITELQLAGKKKMAVADFLRGCRITPGMSLKA